MSEIHAFNDDALGSWSEEETVFDVTRERIVEYAEATNDPIAAHRAGDVAPPVFAIVPVFDALMMPALDVVPIGIFGRLVHGEQDFHFHRPIVPGDVLTSRGKMTGYESLPNGTRTTIFLECRDRDGELVNEQYVTAFFRNVDAGRSVGDLGPAHALVEELRGSAPVAKVDQHIDADQTFRYGPAAGDPMPIHLDEEVARDAGLPGIIAHGLCTMAFTSWAVLTEVAEGDVRRLKRLAVRFNRMVLPDSDLTTTVWRGATGDGFTSYAYETRVGDDVAIKDGLAEIWD
ncbi:MaoC/PaaZ C-terminal domain-containing protein [Nocardioides pelophilus]|uniref:MaoC/PaaZ C-terminal domain-containing protein n=1 Tax=Nocardioides pelophilus TaxID=2172019 RepID=UPI00160392EF|nr:MaoC/PaaZ C-terminal domain-containing protein [Nocardioides pelophilus]